MSETEIPQITPAEVTTRKRQYKKKKTVEPTEVPEGATGLKTEAIQKAKREHIMTKARLEAFEKCQAARRLKIEQKRQAVKEEVMPQNDVLQPVSA